jgi:single-stranded DNA-binding protein
MSVNNFVALDGVIIREPIFSVDGRRYEALLAINDRRRNKITGDQDIISSYHKIVARNTKADLMNEWTKKGTVIHIQGRNCTDNEGNIRFVEVDSFEVK